MKNESFRKFTSKRLAFVIICSALCLLWLVKTLIPLLTVDFKSKLAEERVPSEQAVPSIDESEQTVPSIYESEQTVPSIYESEQEIPSIDEQLFAIGISRQPRAYVTLIATPEYDIGAQILVCRLRQFNRDIPIFVLVEASINLPSKSFYNNMKAILIQVPNPAYLKSFRLIRKETRAGTYTKLQLWNSDNLADLLLYMDADTYPLQDPFSIFDTISPTVNFAVVGDSSYFNTGVFVTRPSTKLYGDLMQRLEKGDYVKDEKNPTEQDVLVSHFANSTQTTFLDDKYNYRPLKHKTSLEDHAVIVHWIGNPKPWTLILGGETTVQDLECNPGIHQPWSTSLYQCAMRQFFSVCHDIEKVNSTQAELKCI